MTSFWRWDISATEFVFLGGLGHSPPEKVMAELSCHRNVIDPFQLWVQLTFICSLNAKRCWWYRWSTPPPHPQTQNHLIRIQGNENWYQGCPLTVRRESTWPQSLRSPSSGPVSLYRLWLPLELLWQRIVRCILSPTKQCAHQSEMISNTNNIYVVVLD